MHPFPPAPPRAVKLNANRHVTGVLRGFDQFMNIVLDGTVDEKLKVDIGMVVRCRAALDSFFCSFFVLAVGVTFVTQESRAPRAPPVVAPASHARSRRPDPLPWLLARSRCSLRGP